MKKLFYPGNYSGYLDASILSSGIYFYKITAVSEKNIIPIQRNLF